MSSCCVCLGLIFTALALIGSAVALVAPYWYRHAYMSNSGLLANCLFKGDSDEIALPWTDQICVWFYEHDFRWERQLPIWWQASQGLFAFGVLCLLTAFLTACVFLCSTCCKSLFVVHLVNGLLVLAFVTEGIALGLFGAKANEEYHVSYDMNKAVYFDWAFWVGCGGVLVDLVAILFYTCEGCRSSSPAGYTRGEVV